MKTEAFQKAQKLRDNGQIEQAIELYKKVRDESLKDGDLKSAAECLHMIGVAYYQIQKFTDADKWLLEAQSEFEQQNDDEFFGFVLRDRGLVSRGEKKLDRAVELLKGSIKKLHKTKNRGHEGISHVKLGRVYADQDRFTEAVGEINKGLKLLSESEDKFFLSSAYLDYAKVLLQMGDKANAYLKAIKSLSVLDSFAKTDEFKERRIEIKKLLDEIKK